jgi:hypothetical protein
MAASWKKVLVSGSAGEFTTVTASIGLTVGTNQVISTDPANTRLSGSFSGSFRGDGSGLTGVTATFPSSPKTSLASNDQFFINDSADSANKYITYDDVLDQLADKDSGTATNVGNIIKSNTQLSLATVLGGFDSITSTYFTGSNAENAVSFIGTASWAASASQAISSSYALTASYALNAGGGTLNISASNNTNASISLSTQALIVSGTANQISVNVDDANNLLQISLPNNVTIPGNLSVTGTTTTVSASSLLVTDKFIILSSGSRTKNDGGIIIQSSTGSLASPTGSGYGFILDGSPAAPRWGVTSSLTPTATNDTTPDEYMVTAKTVAGTYTAGSTAPTYGGATITGNGNMIIDGNGDIWIYVF